MKSTTDPVPWNERNSKPVVFNRPLAARVHRRIAQWIEDEQNKQGERHQHEIISLINRILAQTPEESAIQLPRCETCGSMDCLQRHHIAGVDHDYRTITLCTAKDAGCHGHVTHIQTTIWTLMGWCQKDLTHRKKEGFLLLGLYEILVLRAKKTGDISCERLALKLLEDILALLKEEAR